MVALVDAADFEWLNQWKWHARKNRGFYAARGSGRKAKREGAPSLIYMHRLICPVPDGFVADHINGNSLDNRRCNLRVATFTQNAVNVRHRRNKFGFRGVALATSSGRFAASTRKDGRNMHIGVFDTPEEAARAYDAAVLAIHGPLACLNFPDERQAA
jgi:hypothetical protein